MDKKNRFGEFIANLRREKGITQAQLSEGLCTKSEMSRFERGERMPDKLLQNRFLTRLGVAPENYENFLYYKEYCRWEKRQGIIHYILDENMGKAKELLAEYYLKYDMQEPLEKQFYLAMLVQIRRYENCDRKESDRLFKDALELTVPQDGTGYLRNKVLSLEEVNLLLEHIFCMESSLEHYEELLEYIEKMDCSMLAMAKIYPKTVYYYYTAWERKGIKEEKTVLYFLELCNNAIELLRDANRLFYMWELLCAKEKLVDSLDGNRKQTLKDLEQCRAWRKTLESVYRDAGVSIPMYEFCYLYVESENYCIGDVIRIRRKMLGMSQEKLAEGICDPRRVSKMERNLSRPQKEVIQLLFNKLNLSMELNRTELVTDNPEAVKLYKELRMINQAEEYSVIENKLDRLRKLVADNIPSNEQIIRRKEINIQWKKGIISREEYIRMMKSALECTIPYRNAVEEGEKYFTNEELYCILNIMAKYDTESFEMDRCIKMLVRYFEGPRYPENYLRLYQFVMAVISSVLGNRGDYEHSYEYQYISLVFLLRNRRLGGIHEALYEMLWNKEKQYNVCKKEIEKEKIMYQLERCILISELTKHLVRKKNYEDKLDCLTGI